MDMIAAMRNYIDKIINDAAIAGEIPLPAHDSLHEIVTFPSLKICRAYY